MASAVNQSPEGPRFSVGIDLGTTNSAVCFVDTARRPWCVETFAIEQVVAPGQTEAREGLPSFGYQPARGEFARGALRCSWQAEDPRFVVGSFARDHGAVVPGRLISSAKSWLCHSGVDRTAPLLPWHAAPDVDRLSPVEASACYLAHIRQAWDARHPGQPLAAQDVVLTLPASFDEVARELTVKAAAAAGLPRVVLIEEPQAAFYAWIDRHREDWEAHVHPGQKILVCDIGGGTSDFTLIRVRRGRGEKVQFHRVAVGEHLILGGDNLDLALAAHLEKRLLEEHSPAAAPPVALPPGAGPDEDDLAERTAGKLPPRQWALLLSVARKLKETMLGPAAPEQLTLNLPGLGARLIGGAKQLEVTREEVQQVLVEGFFPRVGLGERPAVRRSGFQEFGLPYAPDPAVTRYLAAFLSSHRHVAEEESEPSAHDPARPDLVLLNGGVFNSPLLRQRVLEVIAGWFSAFGPWQPVVLENERLDLAVARGAAYYGMVRRGEGVRIAAGLARTYYLGVETTASAAGAADSGVQSRAGEAKRSQKQPGGTPAPAEAEPARAAMAICLLPAGVEPGQDVELSARTFDLRVSEPVEFPLYVSSTRLTDRPGELVIVDREQMTPLPPIRTVLRTRRRSEPALGRVRLHAGLTEIGTLDLWCSEVEGRRSWRLQFDVRAATRTDLSAHAPDAEREGFLDEAAWRECRGWIAATFGPEARQPPESLAKRLAEASGMPRNQWPASFCRRVWECLMEFEAGRRRSPVHEARWLNLLGFGLRPGYGLALDDWRVAETWRVIQGRLAHGRAAVRTEGWILWRRLGGGLSAGQQQAVAEPLLGPVRGLHHQLTSGKGRGEFSLALSDMAEIWRLLGSLELLPVAVKIELGEMLLDLLPKRKLQPLRPAMLWALGRIGTRVPVYGPLNSVVAAEVVGAWLRRLLELVAGSPESCLAVMQMARRTEDRYRDLPDRLREKVLTWLLRNEAADHFVALVRCGGVLKAEEQTMVFGESLPKGLRLEC